MSRINLDQFAILTTTVPDKADVTFTALPWFGYSIDTHHIRCSLEITYQLQGETIIILKMSCEFKIGDEDWNALVADSRIHIPKSFMAHLAMHTIGTARGILFCKTEGTPFSQLILPPIDATSMIINDIDDALPTKQ